MNLLQLIRVEQVMMQTLKLVEYKHLLVNLMKKKKKGTRRRNKKIKTSINKSKCISCQKCLTTLQKMKNKQ